MPPVLTSAESLVPHLKKCGYDDARIKRQFKVDQITIPVVAFAGRPFDSWSACVAAVNMNGDSRSSAAKVQMLGAPTVFVCSPSGVDWWGMGPNGPTTSKAISWHDIGGVFREHKDDLAPSRIYNAKLQRPVGTVRQLWFFDVGLMPAVEKHRGEALLRLVEDGIGELHKDLGPRLDTRKAQEDAYRTVFWLLAAKVLHDKNVENFVRIDLKNIDEVFDRIGKHHGETNRFPPFGREGQKAIRQIAETFARCGSLADVSSESIAYVYENALIDKSTGPKRPKKKEKHYDIRKELGIHNTPPVLIQHMLSQMWGMIEELGREDRDVFEPACGHAPFLTAAMRWLRDWEHGQGPASSHEYLRSHLHGLEADAFAIELAKLALTLADEPNGNSWQLTQSDMFLPGVLEKATRKAHILLSNPPYEAFTEAQRARYARLGEPVTARTKATEMLLRTLPHLPVGGVFGVVIPQGILYQEESLKLRRLLAYEFELSEIALFADNLFEKGDAETAIVLGRRIKPSRGLASLSYKRVRERGMQSFKSKLEFSSERQVAQDRFSESNEFDMRIPELEEVWNYLTRNKPLTIIAEVGQGLIHQGKHLPHGAWTVKPFDKSRGVPGFANVPTDLNIFGLPERESINIDVAVIRRPVAGTTIQVPQVLLNYHPVSRDPWRLKALIDRDGHAVTSSFLAIRPRESLYSLEYLWALLNSPVANAYVYCFLQKRNILAGRVRLLPVPSVQSKGIESIKEAAVAYRHLAAERLNALTVANSDLFNEQIPQIQKVPTESDVQSALLRLDAELLKLYNLPPRLERQLLDLFTGVERKGVGCEFRGYYPRGFTSYLSLYTVISDSFQRAAADATTERIKPGESELVSEMLKAAASGIDEE